MEHKKKILKKIRQILDKWEDEVDTIGNECAWTDRTLDELPKLIEKLRKIK